MEAMETEEANVDFTSLPFDVLERILEERTLNHSDVNNFTLTCQTFRAAGQSNVVWKRKILERWPRIIEKYAADETIDWREEYRARHFSGFKLCEFIASMSKKFFLKDEISKDAFSPLSIIAANHRFGVEFLVDELYLFTGPEFKNLTEKYYAAKVMRHLQHIRLKKEWDEYLALPEDEQLLETGAVLLAQWFQPCTLITQSAISQQLDAIALLAREELKGKLPGHPAAQPIPVPLQEVQSSLWAPPECRVVLEALNRILYQQIGFIGNEDDYYDPNNSYINQVLTTRKGIPVSLAVLYISVAKRLGVVCEPINFPSHFVIRFLEGEDLYTYIDVFNNGMFMTERQCGEMLSMPYPFARNVYHSISCKLVFERMLRNLLNVGGQRHQMGDGLLMYRTAAELSVVVNPNEIDTRVLLARLNLHLGINLPEVISNLQELLEAHPQASNDVQDLIAYLTQTAETLMADTREEPDPIVQKLRKENPEVQYSVGLIMKHRRYHYTCVIYGWDQTCEATEEWIQRMHVHMLPNKQFQPFYNVLVDDGSCRYAAQESLRLTLADELKTISHPEVGKYFTEFRGTHYLANEEKQTQYPDDLLVTLGACSEKYGAPST